MKTRLVLCAVLFATSFSQSASAQPAVPRSPSARPEAPSSAPRSTEAFDWQALRGQHINVVIPQYPLFQVFQAVSPLTAVFERETGIKVTLTTMDSSLASELVNRSLEGPKGPVDVFIQPLTYSGYRLFDAQKLTPLDKYLSNPKWVAPDYDFQDIEPRFREFARQNGQYFAIPLLFEAYILMYNKELLKQHLGGKLPKTMNELALAAAEVSSKGERWGVYGAMMRGVDASGPIDTVTGVVMNSDPPRPNERDSNLPYNLWFADDWKKPRVTAPAVARGLKQYAALLQAGPRDSFEIDWKEAALRFQQSKVLFFVDASQFSVYFEALDSDVRGRTGYAPMPPVEEGKPSHTGYWGLGWVIPQNSQHKDAAWYFIQYMSKKQSDVFMGMWTAGPVRTSTWRDPSYKRSVNAEFHAAVLQALEGSRATTVVNPRWGRMATVVMCSVQLLACNVPEQEATRYANDQILEIVNDPSHMPPKCPRPPTCTAPQPREGTSAE